MERLSPDRAELVSFVARHTQRARVTLSGTSMQPLLRAGMVVDIEPVSDAPRIGDILVFRSRSGLVAHRLVGGERFNRGIQNRVLAERLVDEDAGAFITCGDARPDRTELVPRRLVVGRVSAIWSSAEPDAKRVDNADYDRQGRCFARTRALRAVFARMRAYGRACLSLLVADPRSISPPAAFAALVAATHELERGRYAAGVERLCSVPLPVLIEMARRHHASGLISAWLEEAVNFGVEVSSDLRESFRRMRVANALQAGRVLRCVGDVRDRFTAAGIPHLFLKGGARLSAGAPGSDLHFAGDVDVLVPRDFAEAAVHVLKDAGYRDVQSARWRSAHARWLHHRAPLVLRGIEVPVEVHVTLAPESFVSQRLDYETLAALSWRVRGPIGEVNVLDSVGAAVHLSYHARDLGVWRDIVLLARYLRAFSLAERERFDVLVQAETQDGLRLAAAVVAANEIAYGRCTPSLEIRRYLRWVEVREDLPSCLGSPDFIEALLGRCSIPKLGMYTLRDVLTVLRCYLRNTLVTIFIFRSGCWKTDCTDADEENGQCTTRGADKS